MLNFKDSERESVLSYFVKNGISNDFAAIDTPTRLLNKSNEFLPITYDEKLKRAVVQGVSILSLLSLFACLCSRMKVLVTQIYPSTFHPQRSFQMFHSGSFDFEEPLLLSHLAFSLTLLVSYPFC